MIRSGSPGVQQMSKAISGGATISRWVPRQLGSFGMSAERIVSRGIVDGRSGASQLMSNA